MTHARHRATATSLPERPDGPELKGGAPRGMWWVAWRQHRIQVAVLLAIMAAAAAALVILRWRIVSVFTELGCDLHPTNPYSSTCVDANGAPVWWNDGFSTLSTLAHLGMLAGPVVLGAFAAAPIFTREFSRGTHVLALTQSVSRRRWFSAKTTVMVIPLVGGLVALGYLMDWVDKSVGITAYGALSQSNFFARGVMPVATGLMAFGLAIAVGMFARNVVTTLVVGLMLGGAILVGMAIYQPVMLAPERTVTPIAEVYAPVTQAELDAQMQNPGTPADAPADYNAAHIGGGYLDASGHALNLANNALVPCYDAGSKAGDKAATAAGLSKETGKAGVITGDDGSGGAVAAAPAGENYYNSAVYVNASNAATLACMKAKGIAAQYSDRLPGSMLWPLRGVVGGIFVILAALFTGIGAWRLRSAVAKR